MTYEVTNPPVLPAGQDNLPPKADRRQSQTPNFQAIAERTLAHFDTVVEDILGLDGEYWSREFVAFNPRRHDNELGSFSINVETGVFCDFADPDECKGGDLVALAAYVWDCSQSEAARRLLKELAARQIELPAQGPNLASQRQAMLAVVPSLMAPIPEESPELDARQFVSSGGVLEARYDYTDANGALCFVQLRLRQANGAKTFTTLQVKRREDGSLRWTGGMPAGLRPLFGLQALVNAGPDAGVFVVEGEKAALALRQMEPSVPVVTSAGGAQAPAKTDWSPLAGRKVLIWPDNDAAGLKYLQQVTKLIRSQAPTTWIGVIDAEHLLQGVCAKMGWSYADKVEELKGWDAADVIALGLDSEVVHKLLSEAVRRAPVDIATADELIEFSAPAVRWDSGKQYEIRDGSVWVHKLKNGEPCVEQVCSPVKIIRQLRDEGGAGWSLELAVHMQDGGRKTLVLSRSRLSDSRGLRAEMNDHGVIVYNAVEFQYYLEHAIARDTHTLVRKVGWHQGAYVQAEQTYGTAAEPLALDPAAPACAAFGQHGDLETWNAEVGSVCGNNSRLMLSVCTALAGPLLQPLGVESGGLHLVGPSSVGKTTALRVAASVWGHPNHFIHSWRSTSNGLESVAAGLNDSVLLLDEMNQATPLEAGEAVYMLGNGQGKMRMTRSGQGARLLQWGLLFMSTGEIPLQQHIESAGQRVRAGMEVRLLNVPADAGQSLGLFDELAGFDSSKDLADHLQTMTSQVFGVAGDAWLQYLTQRFAELGEVVFRDQLQERLRRIESQFTRPNVNGQVNRAARRFALLALAGELAVEAGIGGWDAGQAIAMMQRCFEAWVSERGGVGASEEAQALRQVQLFFEQHGQSAFQRLETGFNDGVDEARTVSNRAGYVNAFDGMFYVLPEAFKNRVCAGLDHKLVIDVLRRYGLLMRDAASTARVPGVGSIRSYWISGRIVGFAPESRQADSDGGE